jgi:hypothetical protein
MRRARPGDIGRAFLLSLTLRRVLTRAAKAPTPFELCMGLAQALKR